MDKQTALLTLGIFSQVCTLSAAATWTVDDDSCPSVGTGTDVDPFCHIQDAINAAADGDVVSVHAGTYVENINYNGKAILLQSTEGPELTIVDGNRDGVLPVVRFASAEGNDSILDGFTITNGDSTDPDLGLDGGISCIQSSPTIKNCIITANHGTWGGGIFLSLSGEHPDAPVIEDCLISGNQSLQDGGGISAMFSGPIRITGCTIENNNAQAGGGINLAECCTLLPGSGCPNGSEQLIQDTIVRGNAATDADPDNDIGDGGGVRVVTNCEVTISDSSVLENSAEDDGGGVVSEDHCSTAIEHCIIGSNVALNGVGGGAKMSSDQGHANVIRDSAINNNRASSDGGGLWLIGSDGALDPAIERCEIRHNTAGERGGAMAAFFSGLGLFNCLVVDNSARDGGAVYFASQPFNTSPQIINNTIASNSASGVGGGILTDSIYSSPNIVNTILWDNVPDQLLDLGGVSAATVTFCDIQGGWPGSGNIDLDPQFVDEIDGDYHITSTSPCKDNGDSALAIPLEIDFDLEPRIAGKAVDIGMDEFHVQPVGFR